MRRWPTVAALATLVMAACGGGTAVSGGSGGAPKADRVVEVRILANQRFQPESIAVKVGETVTFKVVNEDKTLHEFTLGDEARQAAREKEMSSMGTSPMEMDDQSDSVTLKGGATKQLTRTFAQAATVLYGCHQPGHYAAGEKGTISVS